jgi:hypothetical protein
MPGLASPGPSAVPTYMGVPSGGAQGGVTIFYRLLTGAEALDLPLIPWEYNRQVDEARVGRAYEDQVRRLRESRVLTMFLPTPITVCWLDTTAYLMDGQHRLAVLRRLVDRAGIRADTVSLVLCEMTCHSNEELEEVFVRINSGTQVPAAYYSKKVFALLTQFGAALSTMFSKAVSKAARPQRPNFNLETVRDEMSSQISLRDAIIDKRITVEHLMKVVCRENEIEKQISEQGRRGVPQSILARAEKTGFHLGLRAGWPVAIALQAVGDLE